MAGKLLIVIISGPEDHYNVQWGLRMARNTWTHPYEDEKLESVKVLLFGKGVGIVNQKLEESPVFEESLLGLKEIGVEVSACVSITEPLGLVDEMNNLGIQLVHASQYMIKHVNQGYQIMNF